jgi:catechol 2,3-dioxygenase-like lactoylglutathione lyase family enzyme
MKPVRVSPVFQVADLESAIGHYVGILGFTEDFRYGNYAGVRLGEVCLHLSGHSIHERPLRGGTAYLFCEEVDAYHAEIKARGARIKAEPRDWDDGMRDFMVVDLDGNHLAFGTPCGAAKTVSAL